MAMFSRSDPQALLDRRIEITDRNAAHKHPTSLLVYL
jgi:hypothetical protein